MPPKKKKNKFNIKIFFENTKEWWKKFSKGFFVGDKIEIDSTKQKAIELFLAAIKDENAKLNYSKSSDARSIDSEHAWITMIGYRDNSYIIQINDETKKYPHSHDIIIPNNYASEMADEFDKELEKRFRAMESKKRAQIAADLDVMIRKIKTKKE